MELLPGEQLAFQRTLDTIRGAFERFGFVPVETPAFELTKVLLTKSGGETEKQLYFVQSTGAQKQGDVPELALRFDLTVPLARYVAQHENQLNFPFRRYQIQRVYRGERAQKGRFREFYQCDIDVVGKDTLPLAYDAEVPAVIHAIFEQLKIGDFTIRVNNRKLLKGVLLTLGIAEELHAPVLHEVDRLDKIAREEVAERITRTGLSGEMAGALLDALTAKATSKETLAGLEARFGSAQGPAAEGLSELRQVFDGMLALGVPERRIKVSPATVRGLDYYTGTVYETFLDQHPGLGSICSGGRYENLAGFYTKSKLPGVGISIGITRLFDQLLELKLISAAAAGTAKVLVLNLDGKLRGLYFELARELRDAGINTEVYGPDSKLGKQFQYAERGGVPIALIAGENEAKANMVKLKRILVPDGTPEKEVAIPRAELVPTVLRLLSST